MGPALPMRLSPYRFLAASLPPDHFTVRSFRGREELSGLYAFDVVVTCPDALDERHLLGQRALLALHVGRAPRVFQGVIASVRHQGIRPPHGLAQLSLRLVPRLWLLQHRRRSRIFQDLRVDQILAVVLGEAGIDARFQLRRAHPPREYCTQYEETDRRFITRLAAEAGFFFRYAQGPVPAEEILASARGASHSKLFSGETLIFSDDASFYPPIDDGSGHGEDAASTDPGHTPESPALEYLVAHGTAAPAFDKITSFEPTQRVRSDAATYREYDPERPLALITTQASLPEGSAGLEWYEHHAPFLFPKWRHAEQEPALILRQKRRKAHDARGESTCPALAPGHRFRLEEHPVSALNRSYAVTAVEHQGVATPEEGQREVYRNAFTAVPAEVTFCPPRPKRRSVNVALTATVVGPAGDEVHTDALGQIKVQFHWDREGGRNERSSCWVRAMQAWGGPGWGTQFIPRVGMEVVVTFEGGDPDKPIALGCLYNGTHPPSFRLPEGRTRSGIRTQSSPGGGGFNELSFEDRAGAEQIYLHAQRDLDEVVERDHTRVVLGDERLRVQGNRTEDVQRDAVTRVGGSVAEVITGQRASEVSGNRIEVTRGDASVRVTGDRVTSIEGRELGTFTGSAEIVHEADRTTRVRGSETVLVGRQGAERSYQLHVEGTTRLSSTRTLEIAADEELTLRCGQSAVRITAQGIELSAPSVSIRSGKTALTLADEGMRAHASGARAQMLGDTLIFQTDQGASIAMAREVKLDGKQILLNSPERAEDPKPEEPPPPTRIELVDQEGHPLAHQRYIVLLDDGAQQSGVLDADGKAEIHVKGSGRVVFPDVDGAEPL
jgi:type VI secretion system secreted protein VgrG